MQPWPPLSLNTQTGADASSIPLLFNVIADQAASEPQAAFFSLSNGFKHLPEYLTTMFKAMLYQDTLLKLFYSIRLVA